jgi:hypothetical protein
MATLNTIRGDFVLTGIHPPLADYQRSISKI